MGESDRAAKPTAGRRGPEPERGELRRGAEVDRYVVLEPLGRGGMGAVYTAYDPELDRKLALKILHRDAEDDEAREAERAALLREARALAALSHPNVVAVHDVGVADGRVFAAMELVEGQTLRQWLRRERTTREILDVFVQAAAGLTAAHAAGLTHRDFKPENVLVGSDGRTRVSDFGLAKPSTAGVSTAAASLAARREGPSLTRHGAVVGTDGYIPPEAHQGADVGPAGDQFSFCVTLFEALCGARPFTETTAEDVERTLSRGLGAKWRRHPAWLRATVEIGLAAEPQRRHRGMETLTQHLEHGPRRRARSLWIALALAVPTAVAAAAYGSESRNDACAQAQLQSVWAPARAAQAQVAFHETELPYADASWTTTAAILDRYAHTWIGAAQPLCETEAAGEHAEARAAVRACLAVRLAQLDALVATFVDADAGAVEHAVGAAEALPAVADCLHEVASALAPEQEEMSRVLQVELAAAEALREAGRRDEARRRALHVQERAGEAALPAVEAHARFVLAKITDADGDSSSAAEQLYEAVALARESGNADIEARAWVELVWVIGRRETRSEDGHRLARVAAAALAAAGGDPELEAALHSNVGVLFRADGLFEDAARELTVALDTLRDNGGGTLEVARVMMNLGNVQHLAGDAEQAASTYAEATEMLRPKLGEGHPIMIQMLANSCGALMTSGRSAAAREHCERAVALQEQLLGAEHRDLAPMLSNLANLMLRTGELERAVELAQRAVALFERRTDRESTERIGALLTLAEAHCRLDRTVQARPLIADAESLADTSLFRAHVAATRALCATRAGDHAGGVAGYEAAMAHLEQVDASHPLMAEFLEGIAWAEAQRGRDDAAAAALERALAVSAPQRRTAAGADLVFALAQTLARTGDIDRARRLATEARTTLEASGELDDAAVVAEWLAAEPKAR